MCRNPPSIEDITVIMLGKTNILTNKQKVTTFNQRLYVVSDRHRMSLRTYFGHLLNSEICGSKPYNDT